MLDALAAVVIVTAESRRAQSCAEALAELEGVLSRHGRETERVALVRRELREATRRLLPKSSDDPAAARPGR